MAQMNGAVSAAGRATGDDGHVPTLLPAGKQPCRIDRWCDTKGAPLRKATSSLLRFIGFTKRMESPDWWTYFGSFGNDIFGDEDTDDRV